MLETHITARQATKAVKLTSSIQVSTPTGVHEASVAGHLVSLRRFCTHPHGNADVTPTGRLKRVHEDHGNRRAKYSTIALLVGLMLKASKSSGE